MKNIVRTTLLLVSLLCATVAVQAQKYGYVNSTAIMAELPEVKQVESSLKDLQTQLQKKGQQMVEAYQTKRQDAAAKAERGELSPVEQQKVVEDLGKQEQQLLQYEQEMMQKIQAKEAELLNPVLERVNNAIKAVADENGYAMIFNSSTLLYAADGTDVSDMVKAKLGM